MAWFGLIAVVAVAHLMFGVTVVASVIGWNSAEEPRRIDVSLVRELQPTAPPTVVAQAAATVVAPRPKHAVQAMRAGSAPQAASAPEDAASASREALDAEALALAAAAEAAAASASASAAQVAAAASAAMPASAASSGETARLASAPIAGPPRPSFDWPPSTRLTYTLVGQNQSANLFGHAAVEWRRDGAHYQVQFDIHITPFIDQHMLSDGRIVGDGLSPRRYDESFSMPLQDARVRKIEFGDDDVTLNNGTRVAKLPMTQDGASQFVQFVWMFATHPDLLKPGNVVDIPLALTSSLRRWRYEVVGTETLPMSFGPIDAVHLKPILDGPRRANEYPFEIWVAPSLQYLPVRILVKTNERTYADLSLDALPRQAAAEAPPPPVFTTPPPLPKQPAFGER